MVSCDVDDVVIPMYVQVDKFIGREERSGSVSSIRSGIEAKPTKFHKIEDTIKTGDLAVLYREGQNIPHFAIFLDNSKCDPHFPLLLVKGRTKPLPIEKFKASAREAHLVSAVTRIFYGDYKKVAIRHLNMPGQENFVCHNVTELLKQVQNIPFCEEELAEIKSIKSDHERSAVVCTYMVAHFYKMLGFLNSEPSRVSPDTLETHLDLEEPIYIKLPPPRPGPVASGDPPLLSKLV